MKKFRETEMNRKGVDFTFSWIFAIIAGAVILFSAIYITSQLIESGNVKRDTLVAGELANILNPIETNLEDNRYSVIEFSQETRVYNECSISGPFGVQKLSTSSKTKGDWTEQSVRKSVYNKYIFSRAIEETVSDKLHVMVSPLISPFKIGDVIMIYSGEYCFVNPTTYIQELVEDISLDGTKDIGINITRNVNSCPRNYTKVCFDGRGCDINVNTQLEIVTKSGKDLYYSGDNLLLAAIFSEGEIYECQLNRLMKRASELGTLYSKKAVYIEGSGCLNNLVGDLQEFVLVTNISNSKDFARGVVPRAKDLERRNSELASCKIF